MGHDVRIRTPKPWSPVHIRGRVRYVLPWPGCPRGGRTICGAMIALLAGTAVAADPHRAAGVPHGSVVQRPPAETLVAQLPSFVAQPSSGEKKKLGERLVRKALAQGDDDIMSGLIRLMNEASRELDIEFNPGADTQALQQEIMDGLDDAIKTAAAQRRRSSPDQPRWRSDKRTRQPTPRQRKTDQSQAEGSDSASPEGTTRSVQDAGGSAAPSRDRDIGRGWGVLPPRDRDEVIQGKREESLERYRQRIERYYRALQEADE